MKQTEFFGEGSITQLKQLLYDMGAKRIFLVTGKNSFEKSGAKAAMNDLLNELTVKRYEVISECPDLEFIKAGMNDLRLAECDAVVAVGGGNVIDTAKAVNFFSSQSITPEECIRSVSNIKGKGLPLVAIPTTSGSGSEATHFAVVYSGDVKHSLAAESILPDVAIVDPELTYSLSPYQTAVSGIDVFCQAIESAWATGSNDESRKYSRESLTLIMRSFISAVKMSSAESRRDMSLASNLAGKAINISKTTAPHAVSYSMTRMFGIPHGQAVCITLGEFLKFNYEVNSADCNDSRGAAHVKCTIEEIFKLTGSSDVNDCMEKIKSLIRSAGLKTNLRDLGIDSTDKLELIARSTNAERLSNNPRKITQEALLEILKNVY
ncbi:MAG: phosphonoacetaldehyde reductase [Ignavibacteria bacterium]|nr:phosphonoacetaldehyde reductase [Ignavibacteria bacterium]